MKTLYKNIALFVGGSLFGSAGIKLLGSKDAKNAYTHATAAVLRMKDCVMNTVDTVRENADDILHCQRPHGGQRFALLQFAAEDAVFDLCGDLFIDRFAAGVADNQIQVITHPSFPYILYISYIYSITVISACQWLSKNFVEKFIIGCYTENKQKFTTIKQGGIL